jgi:tetratricopeptide (TPR) repeat protein
LVTRQELEQWLHEGILAAKAGQHEQARFRLLDVVEQDQTNEAAWFWLYQVFERYDDKRICLENLITINPQNKWAQEELRQLVPSKSRNKGRPAGQAKLKSRSKKAKRRRTVTETPRPITLKLIVAFWAGISLVFLGSGVLASGNWLISSLRNRTFPYYITGYQAFELLVALIFVIAGITGLYIAVLLFSRAIAGFYGSVLLALGLLLVGPIISLIGDPPNYLTMICTGGISGMIVLLTLASQSGFEVTE